MADTAFITGTGFYSLPGMQSVRAETVATPFGRVELEIATTGGREVAFLPRHGKGHRYHVTSTGKSLLNAGSSAQA